MSETKWTCRCGFINTIVTAARVCAACGDARTLTPPTPPMLDRAAVREALVQVLSAANAWRMGETRMVNLCAALGINTGSTHADIADALLRTAPLPADVQAAERGIVFLASTLEGHHVSGDGNFLIAREMCAPIAAYLRTLLAFAARKGD